MTMLPTCHTSTRAIPAPHPWSLAGRLLFTVQIPAHMPLSWVLAADFFSQIQSITPSCVPSLQNIGPPDALTPHMAT